MGYFYLSSSPLEIAHHFLRDWAPLFLHSSAKSCFNASWEGLWIRSSSHHSPLLVLYPHSNHCFFDQKLLRFHWKTFDAQKNDLLSLLKDKGFVILSRWISSNLFQAIPLVSQSDFKGSHALTLWKISDPERTLPKALHQLAFESNLYWKWAWLQDDHNHLSLWILLDQASFFIQKFWQNQFEGFRASSLEHLWIHWGFVHPFEYIQEQWIQVLGDFIHFDRHFYWLLSPSRWFKIPQHLFHSPFKSSIPFSIDDSIISILRPAAIQPSWTLPLQWIAKSQSPLPCLWLFHDQNLLSLLKIFAQWSTQIQKSFDVLVLQSTDRTEQRWILVRKLWDEEILNPWNHLPHQAFARDVDSAQLFWPTQFQLWPALNASYWIQKINLQQDQAALLYPSQEQKIEILVFHPSEFKKWNALVDFYAHLSKNLFQSIWPELFLQPNAWMNFIHRDLSHIQLLNTSDDENLNPSEPLVEESKSVQQSTLPMVSHSQSLPNPVQALQIPLVQTELENKSLIRQSFEDLEFWLALFKTFQRLEIKDGAIQAWIHLLWWSSQAQFLNFWTLLEDFHWPEERWASPNFQAVRLWFQIHDLDPYDPLWNRLFLLIQNHSNALSKKLRALIARDYVQKLKFQSQEQLLIREILNEWLEQGLWGPDLMPFLPFPSMINPLQKSFKRFEDFVQKLESIGQQINDDLYLFLWSHQAFVAFYANIQCPFLLSHWKNLTEICNLNVAHCNLSSVWAMSLGLALFYPSMTPTFLKFFETQWIHCFRSLENRALWDLIVEGLELWPHWNELRWIFSRIFEHIDAPLEFYHIEFFIDHWHQWSLLGVFHHIYPLILDFLNLHKNDEDPIVRHLLIQILTLLPLEQWPPVQEIFELIHPFILELNRNDDDLDLFEQYKFRAFFDKIFQNSALMTRFNALNLLFEKNLWAQWQWHWFFQEQKLDLNESLRSFKHSTWHMALNRLQNPRQKVWALKLFLESLDLKLKTVDLNALTSLYAYESTHCFHSTAQVELHLLFTRIFLKKSFYRKAEQSLFQGIQQWLELVQNKNHKTLWIYHLLYRAFESYLQLPIEQRKSFQKLWKPIEQILLDKIDRWGPQFYFYEALLLTSIPLEQCESVFQSLVRASMPLVDRKDLLIQIAKLSIIDDREKPWLSLLPKMIHLSWFAWHRFQDPIYISKLVLIFVQKLIKHYPQRRESWQKVQNLEEISMTKRWKELFSKI